MGRTLLKTSTPTRTRDDIDDGVGGDTDDWYCIKTPIQCGCGRNFPYISVSHLVIVWPEKDDAHLLYMCQGLVERKFKPEIRLYEDSMGPCVSWYAIDARGLQPCE